MCKVEWNLCKQNFNMQVSSCHTQSICMIYEFSVLSVFAAETVGSKEGNDCKDEGNEENYTNSKWPFFESVLETLEAIGGWGTT